MIDFLVVESIVDLGDEVENGFDEIFLGRIMEASQDFFFEVLPKPFNLEFMSFFQF